MNDRRRAPHPLSVLHLIGMLVLLGWWGWYFWQHTPARELPRHSPAHASHPNRNAPDLRGGAGAKFAEGMATAATVMHAVVVDVGAGLAVLVLFGFGTGVYVRRLEIWLQARGSGAAMSLAGTGLDDKALAANARGGAR